MLVSSRKMLREARANKQAVFAFNIYNLESAQAVVHAAEKIGKPIIVQASQKSLQYAGMENLAYIVHSLAQSASVPVVFHLDHGKDLSFIEKALRSRLFTSIMYDGSSLPLEENIKNTARVVKIAHRARVEVEAELGVVGTASGNRAVKIEYTDPAEAKEFVGKTKCDSLAVSFGNVHGAKTANEKLNFEVLKEIAQAIDIPLVFHGASHSTQAEIEKARTLGVAKINIDTQLKQAFFAAIKKNSDADDPRLLLGAARDAMEKEAYRLLTY